MAGSRSSDEVSQSRSPASALSAALASPPPGKLFLHAGKKAAGSCRFSSSQGSNSSRRELLIIFRNFPRAEFHCLVLGTPGAGGQNLSH